MSRFSAETAQTVPGAVIVPDEDVRIFGISHPEHLTLIETPLASKDDIAHGHHGHHAPKTVEAGESEEGSDSHSHTSESSLEKRLNDPQEPILKRAHEAPTIQLFFDLYFVANLTVFSSQHEIHSWEALRSYVGFFTLIWFTWFQNTMFDVRFSNDSAFERLCKAMQFGVMTGFAITGPGFQTGFEPDSDDAVLAMSTYQALSLILMSSRLILALQYCVALMFLQTHKRAVLPMILHMAVMICSALIFLGLYHAFNQQKSERILAGWYILVIVEACLVLAISSKVRFLSFRGTVLVERLGLLTLIILGEGIICLCYALNNVGNDNTYSAQIIGQIICCIVVTYFMYMLYFDAVRPERMGHIRQHVWAVLHFPFHASVVLVVEAMAQLAVWQKVLDVTTPLIRSVAAVSETRPTAEQVKALNGTVTALTERFLQSSKIHTVASFVKLPDQQAYFDTLADKKAGTEEIKKALEDIYNHGLTYVCGKFKIQPHEVSAEGDRAEAIFELFETVFIYFYAFTGVVLLLLATLYLLGNRRKLRAELLSAGIRILFGLGLAALAFMAHPSLKKDDGSDALHGFMYSALMLPTVLLTYFLVIILDNLLMRYVTKVVNRRKHVHFDKSLPQ